MLNQLMQDKFGRGQPYPPLYVHRDQGEELRTGGKKSRAILLGGSAVARLVLWRKWQPSLMFNRSILDVTKSNMQRPVSRM